MGSILAPKKAHRCFSEEWRSKCLGLSPKPSWAKGDHYRVLLRHRPLSRHNRVTLNPGDLLFHSPGRSKKWLWQVVGHSGTRCLLDFWPPVKSSLLFRSPFRLLGHMPAIYWQLRHVSTCYTKLHCLKLFQCVSNNSALRERSYHKCQCYNPKSASALRATRKTHRMT